MSHKTFTGRCFIEEILDIELEDYEGICHSYQEEVKAFHKIVPLEKKWSMSVLTKLNGTMKFLLNLKDAKH